MMRNFQKYHDLMIFSNENRKMDNIHEDFDGEQQ